MGAPRFFVDTGLAAGTLVELPPSAAHHALRVLRLRGGDDVVLFDGRGGEYRARLLDERASRACSAEVLSFDPVDRESALRLTLIQALVAQEKLDWVIEKTVELGVARLILAPAERSVVRLDGARLERRLQRWREIAVGACCQCGRNRVPEVVAMRSIGAALEAAAGIATRLLLDPAAGGRGLPVPRGELVCAVGPEGGFAEVELQAASGHGYLPVALGPRVLRTETAGLAATAALMALAGEFATPTPANAAGAAHR